LDQQGYSFYIDDISLFLLADYYALSVVISLLMSLVVFVFVCSVGGTSSAPTCYLSFNEDIMESDCI
jgi:hypothetical protein